jgi:hypothetical protein
VSNTGLKKNGTKAFEQPKIKSFSSRKFNRKSSAALIKPLKEKKIPTLQIDEVEVVVCEGAAISNREKSEGATLFKCSSNRQICTTERKQASALKLVGLTKVSVKSPQPRR